MCMRPPLPPFCADPLHRVYPHVYGATKILAGTVVAGKGLSPCVWGHLQVPEIKTLYGGSIPMCMGPPITGGGKTCFLWVYPHVYGGPYWSRHYASIFRGLSPSVRATLGYHDQRCTHTWRRQLM